MKKHILMIGLFALPGLASAATIVLPTERVDGTPMAAEEAAELRVFCGTDEPLSVAVAGPQTPFDPAAHLPAGTHECYARVVDTDGEVSGRSNVVAFSVAEPEPEPEPSPARPRPPVFLQD